MDTVYLPAEDSFLMLEAIDKFLKTANRKPKTALDMGTGSGLLAIALAKRGCSITAADINPEAIKAAKENARKEGVKINFALSDFFKNIKGKYDLIVFNPPYVATEDCELKTRGSGNPNLCAGSSDEPCAADMQAKAWSGGPDGLQVINRFLSTASGFLNPGGRILLLVSSPGPDPPVFKDYRQKIIAKKSLFFEQLFVLELS